MQTVEVPVERTPYSVKPELWDRQGSLHLVVPGRIVTSRAVRHGADDRGRYYVETRRRRYRFAWAPTVRTVTEKMLASERAAIVARRGASPAACDRS